MKKICIFCPSLTAGGAEKVAINLANYYCQIGYKVDLLLLNIEGPLFDQVNSKVLIVNMGLKVSFRSRVIFYPFYIRRYLRIAKPDVLLSVIRSTNIIAGLSALGLKNIKLVFREASTIDGIKTSNFLKKHVYLWGLKIAYWKADSFIANSKDTLTGFVTHNVVNESKSFVIPNPVLPSNYLQLANENIKDRFWPTKGKIILSIGRLHKDKNHRLLIEAFANISSYNSNVCLVIIGDGPEKETLKKLISKFELDDRVFLLGFRNNVFQYLKNASLFVLTSKWEGFGNVLVEALSVGTSVVTVDCPGGPKMILENGKYGILVPPDNMEILINAIQKVLKMPFDKQLLMEKAKQYTVERVANQYLKVLEAEIN